MSVTVQKALADAIFTLFESSTSPEIDAEVLLGESLGQSRAWLLTYQEEMLEHEQYENFLSLIERRKNGEPIAYILGNREFWSLNLQVNSATLIPRPETEILVEVALEIAQIKTTQGNSIQDIISIADLGTGSGAIALALASELEHSFITAIDKSEEALSVAKQNAENLSIANVEFLSSHWFDSLADHQFDIICSNPPYIESQDRHLLQGDLRFEPNSALASGADGFFDLQHIIANASAHLRPGGWLVLEHGFQQAQRTRALLHEHGFLNIDTRDDYAKHPRISFGQIKSSEILL